MKHSLLFLSLAAIAVGSCNEPKKSTEAINRKDTSKAIENKIMIPASACYATTTGKDTVHLKVEVFEHVVTGTLLYKLYEKDSNIGEFEGQFHGDTLLADYTFMSEGIRSVRQVVFLIKDSMAMEGYGNMEEKNGKMIFKNPQELIFGKGLIMEKVPCREN
jgi:hypothetical protein